MSLLDHLFSPLFALLFAVLLLIIPLTRHVAEQCVMGLRQMQSPEFSSPVRVAIALCASVLFLATYFVTMSPMHYDYPYGSTRLSAVIYSYGGFLAALASPILILKGCKALTKALICEEDEAQKLINRGGLYLALVFFFVAISLFIQLLR